MNIAVLGLGAGGHARVLIETIRLEGKYVVAGMLDRNVDLIGKEFLGISVLGTDDLLPQLAKEFSHFFNGLGSTGYPERRMKLYEKALALNMTPINIIHPKSIISESAVLGAGIAVMASAVVNACAKIGVNVIVNTGVIVEHDAIIGDHVHLATGARVCGGVEIGDAVHIGVGSTILQGVKIGSGSIIGAGAVVLRDVPSGVTVVGVPARIIH